MFNTLLYLFSTVYLVLKQEFCTCDWENILLVCIHINLSNIHITNNYTLYYVNS